jgi:hypothetical protein
LRSDGTYHGYVVARSPDVIGSATRGLFRSLTTWADGSERRTTAQHFLEKVDWADPAHVRRALRAFERVIWPLRPDSGTTYEDWDLFTRALERDGYAIDAEGRITASTVRFPEGALARLSDPTAIRDQLDRISRAIPDDPALAIGSAKELIESTAKVVLAERGVPVGDRADIQQLIREAQQALLLHPTTVTAGPDGTEGVRKILGGVAAVAVGVAELRNRGYGTGHGPRSTPVGLHPRHAHLAVNAALTWCQLMLDTLADPAAPWRIASPTAAAAVGATSS